MGYDTVRPYLTKVVERAKVDVGGRFGFSAWRRMAVTQFLEQGWSAKHVGEHVGMTAGMVLEVYEHPTQDSHRQMADSLAWD